MDQSHSSCNYNYDCSCPELNTLTEICKKAGAYGSRLTGAGWGGCTVSLVPAGLKDKFFEELKEQYYSQYRKEALSHISDVLFSTTPQRGAFIYVPEKK